MPLYPTHLFLAILLIAGTMPALAQQPDTPSLNTRDRTAIVEAIADHLRAGYVYKDRGETLAAALLSAHESGKFDALSTTPAFADSLTAFLQTHSRDRHLRVGRIRREPAAGRQEPDRIQTPSGVFDRSRPFLRAEILPGNVGHIAIGPFGWTEAGRAQVDSVMNAFRNVDALVFDVGHSPGGGPDAVVYLSSLLFDQPTHLVSTIQRDWTAPRERWTRADIRGPRFSDIPVIILTSNRTFSAAESFTFGLIVTGRARVVGERTGGGGHFGEFISLPVGLSLFLPVGRTYDPRTGKGWEAEGISPDVEVPYADALPVALALLDQQGVAIPPPVPWDGTEGQHELKAAERALLDAYERRDAEALARLLASEYRARYPGGRTSDRAQTLAMMRQMAGAPPARHRTEGTEVRRYANAAVLAGTYIMERGNRAQRSTYRDVWVRRDGRWQLVASLLIEE